MPMLRAAVLAAMLTVPACALPQPEGTGALTQALGQCPEIGCGNGNSPVINGVYFWMLHSLGVANEQGVAIQSVRRADGAPMTLVAQHDQLLGVDGGAVIAANSGLIGTRIRVTHEGNLYEIRIADVTPTWDNSEHFWVGAQSRIEAYEFRYVPLPAPSYEPKEREKPLCSLANNDPSNPMIKAIVFTGDNYDPVTKAITLGPETDHWINIACQGGAPYKQHVIGFTTAAAARLPGISTSLDQRRAMLNAWTMNACGTGRTFTKPGTKITLTESQNLLPKDSPFKKPSGSYEAIWGPEGAKCLSYHRLAGSTEENEQIKAEIDTECGWELPSCSSMLATWTNSGDVLTGNPLELVIVAP